MPDLTIFVSHKMPKDSEAAMAIGHLLALYSGSKIKIVLGEDFRKGRQLTPEITRAIQSSDMFILLYTGEDQDWGYCLLEAGRFEATLGKDENRSIVVFHDPKIGSPKPLTEYISVPVNKDSVYEFLKQIYVDRGIHPGIDHALLIETADKICKAFRKTDVMAINFDLVPNFSIELENSEANKKALEEETIPGTAVFMGTQEWESLFGKNVSTGGWSWTELSVDWVDTDIYEPELARMLNTAIRKRAPPGCFIRPYQSNELFRLTLRRYEEIEDVTRLKFYFTAAPIDIPIFGIHDTTNKDELTVYNMINLTWYARRRLIDQLYLELLSYVNSTDCEVIKIANVVTNIKNEIRNIEIQGKIRGISRPLDVVSVADIDTTMKDEVTWDKLVRQILAYSKQTPVNIRGMVTSLYEVARMNYAYYQISAAKYAEIAQKLQMPMPPPV